MKKVAKYRIAQHNGDPDDAIDEMDLFGSSVTRRHWSAALRTGAHGQKGCVISVRRRDTRKMIRTNGINSQPRGRLAGVIVRQLDEDFLSLRQP